MICWEICNEEFQSISGQTLTPPWARLLPKIGLFPNRDEAGGGGKQFSSHTRAVSGASAWPGLVWPSQVETCASHLPQWEEAAQFLLELPVWDSVTRKRGNAEREMCESWFGDLALVLEREGRCVCVCVRAWDRQSEAVRTVHRHFLFSPSPAELQDGQDREGWGGASRLPWQTLWRPSNVPLRWTNVSEERALVRSPLTLYYLFTWVHPWLRPPAYQSQQGINAEISKTSSV